MSLSIALTSARIIQLFVYANLFIVHIISIERDLDLKVNQIINISRLKLFNKRVPHCYDLAFIFALDKIDKKLIIEITYVNENSYSNFVQHLDEKQNDTSSIKFLYSKIKVNLNSFLNCINFIDKDGDDFINYFNYYFKNYALIRHNERVEIVAEHRARKIINEYFEKKDICPEKYSTPFPLPAFTKAETENSKLRLFNVGQAYMSCLYFDKEPFIIFDLGKSRKCDSAIKLLSNQLIDSKYKASIIISHFDSDHINMAKYLPNGNAKLQFYMPELLRSNDKYNPSIKMLLYKAIINGERISFFSNNSLIKPLVLGPISFLQGSSKKRDINQSSDENSHGLISALSLNGKLAIIPGDVLYDGLFTKLDKPYKHDYIVIPHHSCDYKSVINKSVIDISNIKEAFAFCGPHSRYCHPNYTHFIQFSYPESKLIRLVRKQNIHEKQYVFNGHSKIEDAFFDISSEDYYDWKF